MRDELTTDQKCAKILRAILETVNKGKVFSFSRDWGGHSATIEIDGSHTHVGWTDFTWEQYVDSLHSSVCLGAGLSWAAPATPPAEAAKGSEEEAV